MKKLVSTFGLLTLMLIVTSFTTPNETGGGGKDRPDIRPLNFETGGKDRPDIRTTLSFETGGKDRPDIRIGTKDAGGKDRPDIRI